MPIGQESLLQQGKAQVLLPHPVEDVTPAPHTSPPYNSPQLSTPIPLPSPSHPPPIPLPVTHPPPLQDVTPAPVPSLLHAAAVQSLASAALGGTGGRAGEQRVRMMNTWLT
ncbi:unnamed protein product [Closterium sp. NIES-54]